MADLRPRAVIRAIEYYLPEGIVSNADLASAFPAWPVGKIEQKTGILERHIASPLECSSDLAVAAAQRLFASGACSPEDVDYILFCTQSPDYFLPTTACLIQDRLGVPTTTGALDFNMGCSGFVYGLGLAQGLIESGQARHVLLLTAETYSKFLHAGDKSVRTIFGDAAAATLVSAVDAESPFLGPFVWGTDGSGANSLIVRTGGFRFPRTPESAKAVADDSGNIRSEDNLFMDGAEIFNFTLRIVPRSVTELLARSNKCAEDIDLFVFHQANQYMLDHLRKRLKIPEERFYIFLRHCGNTVSSTIPIALKEAVNDGTLKDGGLVMLFGFGVGYSWAAGLIRWRS